MADNAISVHTSLRWGRAVFTLGGRLQAGQVQTVLAK